jgi:hypothetical protein
MSLFCRAETCSEGCDAAHPCDGGLFCLRVEEEGFGRERTECGSTCDYAAGVRAPEGHACVDGVPVPCAPGAPAAACLQCLYESDAPVATGDICPAGTYCGGGTAEVGECVPQIAIGEPCSFHAICESRNCSHHVSGRAGVCQAAAGTPCTDADCNWCDPGPGGTRVCSQNCTSDGECPRFSYCIGDRTTDQYACRANCWTAPCPTGYRCVSIPRSFDSVSVCLP